MRLEKVQFLVPRWFLKLIFVHSFKGANAGCCLLAAACLLLAVASSYIPLLDGRDVRFLYLMVWDEEGVRWRREFRTSCCGQWWSCAWQLMNQGSFGGSFGGRSGGRSVVFSALVFISVLCLFLFYLLFFLSFSQTVTSSLFIVSFVHSVLLLKSNHCGRMIVCNAKQCWHKSSLQCEGWALSCLL